MPNGTTFVSGSRVTYDILRPRVIDVTNRVFFPLAKILLVPVDLRPGLPIIKDPDKLNQMRLGDVSGFIGNEAHEAAVECDAAWKALYPDPKGAQGIVVVNAALITNGPAAIASRPSPELRVGGVRNADLCVFPRHLRDSDMAFLFAVVPDKESVYRDSRIDPFGTLAHELGHTLLLGHGNGLDDNNDGLQPPNVGARKYDSFCDPLGVVGGDDEPVEDQCVPSRVCDREGSLMTSSGFRLTLTVLQIEQARDAARLVTGARY